MDLMKTPRVLKKLIKYNNYIRQTGVLGTMPRTLFINPNNLCNFNCEQCFTSSPSSSAREKISVNRLKILADEADELGIYEIDIQGGEPLVFPDFFEILAAFGPERFYLVITTNGYLLDRKMAKKLEETGVSRVVVSLDSLNAEVHDRYRGRKGAFEHAIEALDNVKEAGMQPSINFLVGHHNVQSGEVEEVCEFATKRGYQVGLISAAPVGNWKGNLDIMLDEDDTKRLNKIRSLYKNVWRDLWPAIEYGNDKVCSCPVVNRAYINPKGDVLPCPYLHMKIGNIYKSSLKDILTYGFSIRHFYHNSKTCYSAEDKTFAKKYLQGEMSVMNPTPADEIFSKEDFIDEVSEEDKTANNYAALLNRRSIRRFEKTAVDMEIVKEILRAGMYAPSPFDRRPWEFIVVNEREKLDELAATTPIWRMLKRVSVAIVVTLIDVPCTNEDAQLFYIHSCAAASENILIAAAGQGLGAVWLGLHPIEERMEIVRRILNIPANVSPFSVIPIGYAAENIAPKAFFDDVKVHYNAYNTENM